MMSKATVGPRAAAEAIVAEFWHPRSTSKDSDTDTIERMLEERTEFTALLDALEQANDTMLENGIVSPWIEGLLRKHGRLR